MHEPLFHSARRWFGALALAALFAASACKPAPEHCAVCEREVHSGMKATLVAEGRERTACCVSCGVHYKSSHSDVEMRMVSDYSTGREIPTESAYFLYASDLETCGSDAKAIRSTDSAMFVHYSNCLPSILAFAEKRNAQAFQKKYGGRLVTATQLDSIFTSRK